MRLIGYIRVSTVRGRAGDSFISPDVQRDRIEGMARAGGHIVVEWYEEMDQSGSNADRPRFLDAMAMVERGDAEGIAVAKLDRFARSTIDTENAVRRLEAAGGALLCGDLNMDTSTPSGKLMRTLLAALAEFELDRIRENWRSATERHIARGAHHGRPPIGYRKRPDGTLEPNEDADGVREVFRLRAEGHSWLEIRAATGDKWSRSTLATMTKNPTYLGTVRAGELELAGAHEPLVDRGTFEVVQAPPMMLRRSQHGSLLAGILVCDGCGTNMAVNRDGKRGYANYGCRKHFSGWTCDRPAKISVRRADEHVTNMFLEWIDDDLAAAGEARTDRLEPLVAELEQAEAEMALYRDDSVISIIGRDSYVEGLQQRADKVNTARDRVADERSKMTLHTATDILNVSSDWHDLDTDEKRTLLLAGIEEVRCTTADLRGQGSSPADRLTIRFRGGGHDAPAEVGTALTAHV